MPQARVVASYFFLPNRHLRNCHYPINNRGPACRGNGLAVRQRLIQASCCLGRSISRTQRSIDQPLCYCQGSSRPSERSLSRIHSASDWTLDKAKLVGIADPTVAVPVSLAREIL